MGFSTQEEPGELPGPAGRGNQAEIYRVYLKRLNRADVGLGAVEIDCVEKLAAAFRGKEYRVVGGKGGKRRIENFLKGARIGINGEHGDLAGIVTGGKQEPALEIESHHVHWLLAG